MLLCYNNIIRMSAKNSTIHFILTGGTIDSYYEGTKDTALPRRTSVVPEYVKGLKLYQTTRFTQVCMKDSRDLTTTDIKKIYAVIAKSRSSKIIVTHGTYTMPRTARFLNERLGASDKTIVLTGSMIPLVGFTPSDAAFALGYAMAKVQELPPGVFVCMNGHTFEPDKVRKNVRKGRFED